MLATRIAAKIAAKTPVRVPFNGRFPKYLRRHGYTKVYEGPPGMEAFVALDRRHRALVGGK